MKRIKLTQGRIALVDDADYNMVSQYRWYAYKHRYTFYAQRYIGGEDRKTIAMHRFILGLRSNDGMVTDHINNNGLDNQRQNLRICSNAQNQWNQRPYRRKSSSRFKGVNWEKHDQKWRARIQYNSQPIYLGSFDDETEAAKTYDRAALKYFGKFAKLNFPVENEEVRQ